MHFLQNAFLGECIITKLWKEDESKKRERKKISWHIYDCYGQLTRDIQSQNYMYFWS